jgi:hypothetical protein
MRRPSHLFVSFKCAGAIPVGTCLRRDFLIQSTLDGGVSRIEYRPTISLPDRPVRIDAVILDRDDGRFAVDFVDTRPPEDPDAEGLLQLAFEQGCAGLIEVDEASIRCEPRFSSSREVWQYASLRVSASDREQIIETLENEGPIPLRALDGLVQTSRDVVDVVYALACEGSVVLDLRASLGDRAIVRAGVIATRSHQLRRTG